MAVWALAALPAAAVAALRLVSEAKRRQQRWERRAARAPSPGKRHGCRSGAGFRGRAYAVRGRTCVQAHIPGRRSVVPPLRMGHSGLGTLLEEDNEDVWAPRVPCPRIGEARPGISRVAAVPPVCSEGGLSGLGAMLDEDEEEEDYLMRARMSPRGLKGARDDYDDASSDAGSSNWGSESAASSAWGGGQSHRRVIARSGSSESGSSASGASRMSKGSSFSSILECPDATGDKIDKDLEGYAVCLRPLVVTRGELVKTLHRMPKEVLLGSKSHEAPPEYIPQLELLEALCSSIAVLARPGGAKCSRELCLGVGFDYAAEDYALNTHVRTRLVIVARVLGCGTRSPRVTAAAAGGGPAEELIQVKVTEVSSREPFIAEILAMERALRAGMENRLTSESALKVRRRTLRRVADALRALRPNKRSTDKRSGDS